jgi:peptidyl-prolyl cis-trans isomerase D
MVLQTIRDRLNGIVAVFILGLLIIPFLFVGVSSYFTSGAVSNVAVVNEQEITVGQFTQSFQNYRRRMQSMLGANFDPEQFDQAIVRRQHLDNMIDQELLAQVSIDAGLSVSNDRLALAIREVPGFQVDGEFNADVYQSRLASQGISPQQFENDMRSQMVMSQFPSTISSSAISTEWELNDYVRLQEQERAFSAILVPVTVAESVPEANEAEDSLAAVEGTEEAAVEGDSEVEPAGAIDAPVADEIDEESILAWYEAHPDDFRSQEQVIIEYIELDAATMGGEIAADEEQLKARFEEQEARFITPESRLASHILIEVNTQAPEVDIETARELAAQLSERAKAGEDFVLLATENSQDAGSAADGGDLGWVEPGFMVQAFEDGLYALTEASPISEPVQSGFGWHVIYLREIKPSEGMSFTEARDILLAEYQAEADERRFLEQADRMVDIIYEDPTTLETAAMDLGLEVQQAGPFGRAGGVGVAANPEVVKEAFSDIVLLQSAVSDPVDLGENHLAMILLKEHLPEAVMPLAEVRDQVLAGVRADRAREAARVNAEALLAQVSADSDMAALAELNQLELLTLEAATRTSADIQADLREQLFLMDVPGENGPVIEVLELDDGFAILRLEGVTDGALSEEDALRAQSYNRRISNATASAETFAFIRMLRSQSTIEVFEDRL